jgi:hypothetical protein
MVQARIRQSEGEEVRPMLTPYGFLYLDMVNNKFWEELICLLSLHKLAVNNIECHHLHTKFHTNPPIGSKVIKGFLCTHLRSLIIRHFGMAEATRFKKNVTSMSSSMTSPAYQIS